MAQVGSWEIVGIDVQASRQNNGFMFNVYHCIRDNDSLQSGSTEVKRIVVDPACSERVTVGDHIEFFASPGSNFIAYVKKV